MPFLVFGSTLLFRQVIQVLVLSSALYTSDVERRDTVLSARPCARIYLSRFKYNRLNPESNLSQCSQVTDHALCTGCLCVLRVVSGMLPPRRRSSIFSRRVNFAEGKTKRHCWDMLSSSWVQDALIATLKP